jgi:hypothetical protein
MNPASLNVPLFVGSSLTRLQALMLVSALVLGVAIGTAYGSSTVAAAVRAVAEQTARQHRDGGK